VVLQIRTVYENSGEILLFTMKKHIHNIKYSQFVAVFVCMAIFLVGTTHASEPVVKKYSAVARKSIDFGVGAEPQKLEFKFDGASAWVREDGSFHVEAEIKHGSLLCGTYRVGINFGIGKPACTNVNWVADPHYVTKRKQCNNAWMVHAGSGNDSHVVKNFNQITCAQILIKCTGKCN